MTTSDTRHGTGGNGPGFDAWDMENRPAMVLNPSIVNRDCERN